MITDTLQAMRGYEPRDIRSTDYIFCKLQTTVEWISVKQISIHFDIGVPFNIGIELADLHLFVSYLNNIPSAHRLSS
jgi:acid phosphatase class B